LPVPSNNTLAEPPRPEFAIGAADLRLKLVWLTVFRTVATTLLLSATVVRLLSQPLTELTREDTFFFGLIAIVYLSTLIYGLILRRHRVGPGAAYAQVLGDVLLASGLVYLTGGSESPFIFAYSLGVIAAAILLYQRGALLGAVASSVAFGALSLLIQSGLLRSPQGSPMPESGKVWFAVVSNTLAQVLIAALANYLVRQLWTTGGRLSQREADLKKIVDLHRQILACMLSGLVTCEQDGTITFVNKAAEGIFGLGAKPRNIEELIPGVLKLGPVVRRWEVTVQTQAGQRIIGLSVTPLEGQSKSLLVVFQDLTDLRALESELRRVDHLASLGTLAAQLAHEIQNPLAAMRGSAQMLGGEAREGSSSKRLSTILVRESDRLTKLVEDFLHFARPPAPVLRLQSLCKIAEEAVEMLRADPLSAGIDLELSLSETSAYVDPDQIRQILLNLIRNAFAAVGRSGRVRISVEKSGPECRIRVWDSGGQIPQSELGRIFDPFYTTQKGGTGLGLSIAHSIVRAHGGMIQVSSSPENGTEFVVTLPAAREASVANSGR
jgi:two-component system, NtrC family, sensor histidine kinase PilS